VKIFGHGKAQMALSDLTSLFDVREHPFNYRCFEAAMKSLTPVIAVI
jgi:hypothetical protein